MKNPTIEELEAYAAVAGFNFKSYDGYISYIPEDELPEGPENWTVIQVPRIDCSYTSLIDRANGVIIAKELHQWMTGEFSSFFDAPEADAIVYMDSPEDAKAVLIRVKKDGDFTEPFRWLVAAQDYITSFYPLLPKAEEVHSDLERSELLSAIFDYCYEYLEDVPEAKEQAEWVAELAKILYDEHSICDSGEFAYYAYDDEFDLDSTIQNFLTSKGLMMREEEPETPHKDLFG